MKNNITKYIQFAIYNDYKFPNQINQLFHIENNWKDINIEDVDWFILYSENIIEIITSKPFIEAIARGIIEISRQIQWEWSFLDLNKNIEEITLNQAIAIRDDKLEEFITNLWIWQKQ